VKTIDDLRTTLDDYADRGDACGADEVWTAANATTTVSGVEPGAAGAPTRALPLGIVALVAACVLLVTFVVVRSVDDEAGVVTTPGPDTAGIAPPIIPIPSITVSFDGPVDRVAAGFGRIWVTTFKSGIGITQPGALRSFDATTGELLTEVRTEGFIVDLRVTDRSMWARVRLRGIADPAGSAELGSHTILRIDPVTSETTRVLDLSIDGPFATSGDRVAAADLDRLVILDETDTAINIAEATIEEVTGVQQVERNLPFEPLSALAFGSDDRPDALYAMHEPRGELLELDPATGRHRATRVVSGPASPSAWMGRWVAPSDGIVWVLGDFYRPIGIQAPIGASSPDLVEIDRGPLIGQYRQDEVIELGSGAILDGVSALVPLGDSRVLALTRFEAVVTDGAGVGPYVTPIDPAKVAMAITHDGRPWIAQWDRQTAGPPVVTFVLVDTGDAAAAAPMPAPLDPEPAGAPGTTPAPDTPPSTRFGEGAPALVVMSGDPLREGETYALLSEGLPPGSAVLVVCPPDAVADDATGLGTCRHEFEPEPDQYVTVADNGSLAADWIARRSTYDDRWHDCAVERCTLRLYGQSADGTVDRTALLAETAPLVFADDTPPRRPSLTVTPAGPIAVGSTVTINGESFPVGARGIDISICRTGDHNSSCYFNLRSMDLTPDADGRVTASFTVARSTVGAPQIDPSSPLIDCTTAPGTCSFNIFPMDASKEPYATVPVEIVG